MSSEIKILLIEDEEYDINRIKNTIKNFESRIRINEIVSNGIEAIELLKKNKENYDVVIMDYQIAGGLMGEELIHKIKEIDSCLQIIVITKMTINASDYDFANKLIKSGAFWYCTKYPSYIEDHIYQPTDFILSIFNAYEKYLLERKYLNSSKKFISNVENILKQRQIYGNSPEIQMIKEDIKKCAESEMNVLITGSSGTGKELVGYNIHYQSDRKFENFVTINCGSIPNDLVESELFGYESGAFTGAKKAKPGLFEIANNGTVFLDEITELPLQAQVKLLRFLQEGEIEKIGRTEKIRVNVRIIAATNKNILEEVKAKKLREDLYYRLNVIQIFVPELKHRTGDVKILLDHFLQKMSSDMGKNKPKVEKDALDLFSKYPWPGNVRELKNVVQRLLFRGSDVITHKQAEIALGLIEFGQNMNNEKSITFPDIEEVYSLKEMEKVVREKYFQYVRKYSESDSDAAKKLGLAPSNFYRMSKELGLK